MKSNLVRVVSTTLSLGFYLHFFYIPLMWFLMLGDYTSSSPVIVTRIEHGIRKGEDPIYTKELPRNQTFAIEDRSAKIHLRSDSLIPYIFFFEAGDWGRSSLSVLSPFFTMALLWFLVKIFDSLDRGEVFTRQNADRIKWIGWILISKFIYSAVVSAALGQYLEAYKLPYEWARGSTPDGSDLYLGFIVLCIGLVYQKGVELKQEAELVV